MTTKKPSVEDRVAALEDFNERLQHSLAVSLGLTVVDAIPPVPAEQEQPEGEGEEA